MTLSIAFQVSVMIIINCGSAMNSSIDKDIVEPHKLKQSCRVLQSSVFKLSAETSNLSDLFFEVFQELWEQPTTGPGITDRLTKQRYVRSTQGLDLFLSYGYVFTRAAMQLGRR